MEGSKFSTKYHENLIGKGKLIRYHEHPYESVTVLDIDLEHIAARLKTQLSKVMKFSDAVRNAMPGVTMALIEGDIERAVNAMVDYSMFQVYNRLRTVAEKFAPATRIARMNTRAPYSNDYEIPEFLASTLSSIGPLHISDGLAEQMIIYATDANRAQRYGREGVVNINFQLMSVFINALKKVGVPMAKIDTRNTMQGSFFTTIIPILDHHNWTFKTTQIQTHYEDLDLVRAWLCLHDDINNRGFKYCGLLIERNTTTAVTNALVAARPEGVAAAVDGATHPPDPMATLFPANFFGIDPAVAAAEGVAAAPAATYVLGRGRRLYLSMVMGSRLTETEMLGWATAIMLGE